MIFVKYNRRYNFFDEDLYNASDSSSKHFTNDLATRAATKIFPCKNKKIENSVLKEGVEATVSILVPFLVVKDRANVEKRSFVGEFAP